MAAEEASTDEKTAKKQWKTGFAAKTSRYSSKFKFLNAKFEFQASFFITNLKYHNMKRLRSIAAEEASTDEKTTKIQWKTGFGAKTSRYSSKFKFLNSKFELQASFFSLLTSNITYMKRLRSMDAEEASTDEKTAKIQWKTGFGRQN